MGKHNIICINERLKYTTYYKNCILYILRAYQYITGGSNRGEVKVGIREEGIQI